MLARLGAARHVALDLDGTVYRGETLLPAAAPFLATLKELGLGYSFITNNPSRSQEEYLAHLRGFGLPATAENLRTSVQATIEFLGVMRPVPRRLFILGTSGMGSELSAAGFNLTRDDPDDEPDAVV